MLNPFRKHPALIVHGAHPLNAEPPLPELRGHYLTPQDLLYVRSHGDVPKLDGAAHRVAVRGLVSRPLSLSLADIRAMPSRTVRAVMQCAGNRRADMRAVRPVKGDPWAAGAIGCADWTGTPLAAVLEAAGARRSMACTSPSRAPTPASRATAVGPSACRCRCRRRSTPTRWWPSP